MTRHATDYAPQRLGSDANVERFVALSKISYPGDADVLDWGIKLIIGPPGRWGSRRGVTCITYTDTPILRVRAQNQTCSGPDHSIRI